VLTHPVCNNQHVMLNKKTITNATRPAKIDHVGTFKYLKYSMPHNSPMPDSSRVRFTLEVQQGNSY